VVEGEEDRVMTFEAVVVKYGQTGYGWDTQNVALFGTRHRFSKFTTDESMQRVCEVNSPVDANEPAAFEISQMSGIVKVCNYDGQYDLVVIKATAFTWQELLPEITSILEDRHKSLSNLKEVSNG
jgi:hypothetical protein